MWKQPKCPSAVNRSTACGACILSILSWKRHAKYEKPITKKHILSSCIYMLYPEQPNLYRLRVERWLPKAGVQRTECWGLCSILGGTAVFSHRLWWSPQHQTPTFSIVKKKSLEVYVCIKRVNSIVCAFLSVVLQPITWKDTHLHS